MSRREVLSKRHPEDQALIMNSFDVELDRKRLPGGAVGAASFGAWVLLFPKVVSASEDSPVSQPARSKGRMAAAACRLHHISIRQNTRMIVYASDCLRSIVEILLSDWFFFVLSIWWSVKVRTAILWGSDLISYSICFQKVMFHLVRAYFLCCFVKNTLNIAEKVIFLSDFLLLITFVKHNPKTYNSPFQIIQFLLFLYKVNIT